MLRSSIRLVWRGTPLAGLLADPAAAQNALAGAARQRHRDGEIVRIGDLVENAGPVADVPIFRSPDLGTRGAVADRAASSRRSVRTSSSASTPAGSTKWW